MSLCWKCREEIVKEFPYTNTTWPKTFEALLHCHHDEPEEKPKEKCWCKIHPEVKHAAGYFSCCVHLADSYMIVNFCPECGKKL